MVDNQFKIFAHGDFFDPDTYLASAPLKFDGVWRKGELWHDHPKSSGVFKDLGDGLNIPFQQQEQIAIEYLSVNRNALRDLARHPKIMAFIIGLEYRLMCDSSLRGFCVGPSADFMWHCLDVGILPNYYITIEHHQTELTSE